MTVRDFADQPAPVRAVIDLAALRQAEHDDTHDRVLAAFTPDHADTVREIWRLLDWIDRCGWENSVTLLNAYYGPRSMWGDPDMRVDELCAELQGDVLRMAQLVASVMHRRERVTS